jgi:hypothetical protein
MMGHITRTMLPVGSRLGPYEITAPLSVEGTETYRAYDHRAHREVTLQVSRIELDVGSERPQPDELELYHAVTGTDAVYVVSASAARDKPGVPIEARTMSIEDATRWALKVARASGAGPQKIVRPRRWRWTPRRRRAAWTAAAASVAALALIIALAVGRDAMVAEPPAAAPIAPADADRAVPPVPAQPQAAEPTPDPAEAPPADAAGGADRIDAPDVGAPPIADTCPAPAPSRPSPTPAEPPPPAAAPAAPVRPLSPVVADARDVPSLVTEASVRADEFDLAGAFALLTAAASRGDVAAQVAALYIGGLLDAREAFLEGGPATAVAGIHDAIMSLQAIATGRPGSAEIARLTLHAAAAASQSERDEMSLYLETALEMESLQRMARLPGAPLVSAAEVAGDLWLQVHRYEEARRAYTEAAARVGSTLRILSGLARTARRLDDTPAACASYRRLLDAWGGRPGLPVEIAEARAYVGGCAP